MAGAGEAGGAIDFGRFLVQRLQRDLAAARRGEAAAVEGARRLVRQQARIHEACFALIDARNFEQFVEAITHDVANTLRIDAVGLCIEAGAGQPNGRTRSGVNLLPSGAVNALLGGPDIAERGRDTVRAERLLYGGAASLIGSDLLIRLASAAARRPACSPWAAAIRTPLPSAGGRQPYLFLARVIESTARAWLDLPG